MRRRVWSVEEIEGILRAVHEGNGRMLATLPEGSSAMRHYQEGFRAALAALAIALGLIPTAPNRMDAALRAGPFPMIGD